MFLSLYFRRKIMCRLALGRGLRSLSPPYCGLPNKHLDDGVEYPPQTIFPVLKNDNRLNFTGLGKKTASVQNIFHYPLEIHLVLVQSKLYTRQQTQQQADERQRILGSEGGVEGWRRCKKCEYGISCMFLLKLQLSIFHKNFRMCSKSHIEKIGVMSKSMQRLII